MFYTYVLKSLKDNEIYIGFTEDLKVRLDQYNKGLVSATKSRIPFKLVYYEACLDKNKAVKREKSLKTGFGRKYLKDRI
jgi:putative endonuclease